MTKRSRSCTLAVAIAALWTAAEARGESNALWELPEDERYYLLRLAGGEDRVENRRSGRFRSSHGEPLSFRVCINSVGSGAWGDDPEDKDRKACLDEFPAMVLKRMHSHGYKNVRLGDVADVETFSFYSEMLKKAGDRTREERDEFLRGYLAFKKRLGVYMIGDRALENSLGPPKKYIIQKKR